MSIWRFECVFWWNGMSPENLTQLPNKCPAFYRHAELCLYTRYSDSDSTMIDFWHVWLIIDTVISTVVMQNVFVQLLISFSVNKFMWYNMVTPVYVINNVYRLLSKNSSWSFNGQRVAHSIYSHWTFNSRYELLLQNLVKRSVLYST